MSTVLVVDDSAICREPIAAALERCGYMAVCADSGAEALSQLRNNRVDLVLLDLTMPELDGFAVLRAIRRNPQFHDVPVIILTGAADRDAVVEAARIGIQGYILKSHFSLEYLLSRVGACLGGNTAAARVRADAAVSDVRQQNTGAAVAEAPPEARRAGASRTPAAARTRSAPAGPRSLTDLKPVVTRDKLIELVNEGLELRPLGLTVSNVMAATGNARCSADDVARVVGQDQALSIRLLKLANSSTYARGRPVDSVKEAVQRIGIHEVRSMVMTLGVVEKYTGKAGEHVDPRLFWEHSIGCGLVAAAIAKARHSGNPDEFFLWGLLHDVGRIILLDHVAEAYGEVWKAADGLGAPLEVVEARMMLMDHCDILARALEHWQFPHHFIAPVVNHHQTVARIKRMGPKVSEPAATIALANRIAHALMLGSSGNDVIYPLDELTEMLSLNTEWLMSLADEIIGETNDLKFSMLARSNVDDWPDSRERTRQRLGVDVGALCCTSTEGATPYPLLFGRLQRPGADEPSLGVLHVPSADQLPIAFKRYDRMEQEHQCGPLPLLIIYDRGRIGDDLPVLNQRPFQTLQSPVRLDQLITAIQNVLPAAEG